jgi:hypothetical protein
MDLRDMPDQQRQAGYHQFAEAAQQFEVVLQRLAEAETRVDRDAVQGDARRLGAATRSPRNSAPRHDIGVVRILLHGARIALHVHQAYPGLRWRRPASSAPGARRALMSLIMSAPARARRASPRASRYRPTAARRSRAGPRSPAAGDRFPAAPIPVPPRPRGLGAESRMCAPSSTSRRRARSAASVSPRRPSPEKESSDRLTMPMISGRSAFST